MSNHEKRLARKYGWLRLLYGLAVFALCTAALGELLLWPEATGAKVSVKSGTELDYSHAEDGYIMVRQKAGNKLYKLRIAKDGETYTYDLNNAGEWEVFPLQLGTGNYSVRAFRQASGKQYSAISNQSVKVDAFSRENASFLCPNQYVWYTADSPLVTLSGELCQGLETDGDKVQAIREWVQSNIHYDYVLALTVGSGWYLPDLDELLEHRLGICFDYASLTAAMLRVQGIPTKLVIGYADQMYHAWNEAYLNGQWMRLDTTAQATHATYKVYTTERFY